MVKKLRMSLNIALTVFFLLAIFANSPNLNPIYADGAFTWAFIITAYIVVNFLIGLGGLKLYQDERGRLKLDIDKSVKGVKKGFVCLGIIWGAYFLVNVLSSPIVNFWAYRDQLGTPVKSEFNEKIQPVDLDQIPVVDKLLAYNLADKKLGENPGMGSQVVLGEPVIQQLRGDLVWVVPLEHSGFFKWLKNIDGSAGYIIVSATDMKDVRFVGDYKIKYQGNAFFFDEIVRNLRFRGNWFIGVTDYSFEIDESGVPHWIITTYKNKWMFALPEATGVIIMNATTGECKRYSIEDVPEWVDRVQPEGLIVNQINNQGQFVHGIFNFSNQDKFKTSKGNIIVYNDGKCYLFTGLTSVGADEAAIGFIMVDMVTKEAITYQMSGATESAAQASAQGKVQQYGYNASFPIIINLDGIPTYVMTLKDAAGLVKQYAFVSVSDYTSVGVGESLIEARRSFKQALKSSDDNISDELQAVELQGTIDRIASENLGDIMNYKFILKEYPDKLFIATYDLNDELTLTRSGDRVKISYVNNDTVINSVVSFDNLDLLG